jgi:hypothetical protein
MAGNKGTILIRNICPNVPSYAQTGGGGFNLDSVKWMLSNLQPDHVVEVGDAYLTASNALAHASTRLHQVAHSVVEAWSGKDADLALGQLGQLNTTAAELQEKSATTGTTYHWLGKEILPWYKNEGERMGAGHIHTGGDDHDALEMLDRYDNRIVQGFNSVPAELHWDLPPATTKIGSLGPDRGNTDTGDYGSPPGGGVPPSGMPTGSPPGGGIPGHPGGPPGTVPDPTGGGGVPNGPGGDMPGHSDIGGTSLAGMGGGGAMDPLGAGGLGGAGLGGGAGGAPGGLGGGGLGGAGVLGAGGPGSIGAGRKGGAAGEGTTGRSTGKKPSSGAPLGGAGGGHGNGEGEEERERTTWLTEDEDIWTDHGDIAPPVIE